MTLIPWLTVALALFAAACAFFLGPGIAAGAVFAALVIAGAVSYGMSPNAFQLFLMTVSFGAAFVIGSAGLGIAAGLNLRKRRFILAALLLAPFPWFVWHTHSSGVEAANEKQLAYDFVTRNPQLIQLVGGPVKVYPASATTYSDSSRGRYEYSLMGGKPLYAIVDVSRSSGKSNFRLACVTTLSMGAREAGKDDCLQSTVPLPK
ncbi:hypothetical protein [Polaromonas sp. YR568]|uniref:hypothetical protein n=1 Tax=Polaromonas sp. YR568 TaxID=1855301 RepID=UPI00398BD4C1